MIHGRRPVSHSELAPSRWVTRWAEAVVADSQVLDVASGDGRHARLFAARGCAVVAVDRDAALMRALSDTPRIEAVTADIENGAWPFADAQFDAVVVTNYLHRPLFPLLVASLASDGLLIYETFAAGNAAFGRPSNPDFLLRPRELLDVFGAELRVLAFEDGFVAGPKPAMVQRIAARRAEPRAQLAAERCRL